MHLETFFITKNKKMKIVLFWYFNEKPASESIKF